MRTKGFFIPERSIKYLSIKEVLVTMSLANMEINKLREVMQK